MYEDVLDADKQLYVYEKGSNVAITSYGKLYDGNGVSADNFRISAKGTSEKDYTKKIVDSEGKTVSEAVSAGDYKLVATSKKYKLTGTTEMPVTVKKVDLTTKAANLVKWNEVSGQEYLPLDKAIILVNNSYNAIEALDLRADTGNAAVSGDPVADFAGFDRIADCADVVVSWERQRHLEEGRQDQRRGRVPRRRDGRRGHRLQLRPARGQGRGGPQLHRRHEDLTPPTSSPPTGSTTRLTRPPRTST